MASGSSTTVLTTWVRCAAIDTARSRLESRDVTFDGDTLTIAGLVRLATFYDPDGNKLMLAQDLLEQD